MILYHPEIISHGLILCSRDDDRVVLMRFPRSDSICGRSHDDTPDSGSSELVIKDIPRAACLVTAYRE